MKTYVAAGFDPARFFDITPRLMSVEMDGAAERRQHERAMVWYGAMLPHFKKPPSFDQFVKPKARAKRQTPDQQQAMLTALAAAWGAKVVH